MATGLFTAYTEYLLNGTGTLDVTDGTLAVGIIPASSPPDLNDALIVFESDLAVAVADNSHRTALASVTVDNGIVDAADTTIASAATNAVDSDIFLFFTGGVINTATSNRLVAYFDLGTPFQPNGQDVNVIWNASGIFKLG